MSGRVYSSCCEMISEEVRNIVERGVEVSLKTYQDKNIENNLDYITKEIIGETFTITNTKDYEEMYEYFEKKFKVKLPKEWADSEFLERISTDNINPGTAYLKRKDLWEQFLKNDGKFHYTYNERISPFLNDIIKELKRDTNTRRAYLSIFDPNKDFANLNLGGRITCSLGYQFLIRKIQGKDKLHIIYMIRSNDVFNHFINDVYLAIKLQRYVAEKLNIEPGYFTMFISSFHAYYKDLKKYNIF